jgi:SAM-dependent methyltransferase
MVEPASASDRRDDVDDHAYPYGRTRPAYPSNLFGEVVELAGPGPDRRLLEIDAGTGTATVGLAFAGFEVTALEPNPKLAAVLVRETAYAPRTTVVNDEFETWLRPEARFRIVFVTSVSHWLPSAARLDRIVRALLPGGLLVVVETHLIAGGDDRLLREVHEHRRRLDPSAEPDFRLPTANQIGRRAATTGNGWFDRPRHRRHQLDVTDLAARHVNIELAYPHHRALPEPARTELRESVRKLQEKYVGAVKQPYLFQLWAAERLERRRQVRVRRSAGAAGSGG